MTYFAEARKNQDTEPEKKLTSSAIAKHVGISSTSYERTKKIIQMGRPAS